MNILEFMRAGSLTKSGSIDQWESNPEWYDIYHETTSYCTVSLSMKTSTIVKTISI